MMLMSVATFAAEGWPANYGGVMLQAFWWDSYADTKWTALEGRSDELSKYFDLIWIPNAATTADHAKVNEMGYMPCYYLDYNTCFGTEAQLRSLINTYKAKGTGIIEDVVINHKNGFMSWCNFPNEEVEGTNTGKTYSITWDNTNYSGICKNDEANSNANSGVAGKIQGNYDTGDNFDGCRDLDHTNALVQQNIKTYLDYMKNELGFAGWRYDMVKGYSPAYTKIYNESCDAQFSVGEYWASENETKGWIDGTGKTSAAFDFDLKYNIARAFDEGNWQALGWRSFTGNASYARYSVTFVDNHDTGRTDGQGSKPLANNWSAANAYILAIPGTPCVWLKHYNADKTNIGKMILARKAAGITNQSSVLNEGQKDGGYYIETQGTKGKVYVLFGGAANGSAPSGYTLIASGDAYKFYSTVTSDDATVELSPVGSSFKTETLDVTLKATNATSAWYQVDGGAKTPFTGTATVTIGSGVEAGTAITVKWGATDKNGKETTGSATYTKKDPNATTVIYLKNASNWSDVYAYVYSGTTSNGEWPGVKMTKSATADYDYSYTLPDELADGCKVIFTESLSATTNRYPADGAEGLECGGKSMLFNNSTKAWGEYSTAPVPTPVPATGLSVPATLSVKQGSTANITVTYTPANASEGKEVTWTSDNVKVATVANGVVTAVAEGTATITATLANGATAQCVVTVTEGPAVPHFTGYRVYFENTGSWATVNCYAWDSNNTPLAGAWPGSAMTKEGDYYYITFSSAPANVIFNNGSDKTDDLKFNNGYLYKADDSSEQYAICDGQGDDPTPPTPVEGTKLYFENTGNWSKVYCYVWTPEAFGDWPGTEVTEKEDKYFVVTVTDAAVTNVIFNNGDRSQTSNLTIRANAIYNASGDTGKTYTGGDDPTPPTPEAPEFEGYRVYYNNTNNWATPYCYAWNATGNNTWPGSAMTKDDTTGYWYADFDFEPTNVIFSNNRASQTANLDFGNGYLYQADGTSAPYAKHKDTPVPPVVKVGDVDLDGDVDADDYDAIVDIILQKTDMPAADTDAFTAADANADGTIDAEDIMAVELMIATPDIAPTGIAPTKDLRISVASATPVAQLQFVMTLPNGMTPVELTATTADNHEVTLVAKGGKYLATVLSDDNSNITEDIVLKMQFVNSDSPVSFSAVQAATGGADVQAVAATLSAQFDEEPVVETAISCETAVSMKANSTHAIDLNITSDDHIGVVAANISLPEGITFADNALASSVDNMPFLGNTLTDGSMQVVLSSPSAALIHPSADAKFGAFTVKSGSKLAAGAQIVISDITVVNVAAAGTPLADIVINVTVEDDLATGISTILSDDTQADIYDVAGRHLGKKSAAQLPKGIYIINGHKVIK